MTPEDLVGLLAEPARLRLLAAVALGARTARDGRPALEAGGAVDHAALRRSLVEGGHLVRGSGIYALPSDEPPPLGAGERLVAGLGLS